jgi:hypothetical protein
LVLAPAFLPWPRSTWISAMHSHARTSAKTDATLVLSRSLLPLILSPEMARRSSQKKLATDIFKRSGRRSACSKIRNHSCSGERGRLARCVTRPAGHPTELFGGGRRKERARRPCSPPITSHWDQHDQRDNEDPCVSLDHLTPGDGLQGRGYNQSQSTIIL